jgi:tRNA dimethylallyltransferase
VTKSSKPKVVAIIGATATGKTAVGVELALEMGGEVVNGDSRLFYRGMDVATAKPSLDETKGVRHHLIDFLEPSDRFSLANYLERAKAAIEDITTRRKVPILVGGSGQYVWALLEGWDVPKIEPDIALRNELESVLRDEGVESLSARLEKMAPDVAAATDLKNQRRVIRAIERIESGQTDGVSSRNKADEPPFDARIIGLSVERAVLHERVVSRLNSMLESGWVAEVESLLAAGYSSDDYAMSGIGYRQMIGHMAGEYDFEEAVRLTVVATNRLIRHQNNWFKHDDARITWYDMGNQAKQSTESIISDTLKWLESPV